MDFSSLSLLALMITGIHILSCNLPSFNRLSVVTVKIMGLKVRKEEWTMDD